MKKWFIYIIIFLLMIISGCSDKQPINNLPDKGTIDQGGISFFPASRMGYVCCPVPFFDGENLNIFYLDDEHGNYYYSSMNWNLMQTKDFLNWNQKGDVITYDPNNANLWSGTVIRDKYGIFHAFYNATDDDIVREIKHAISSDLKNWVKRPNDDFVGGIEPYVLYMPSEDKYWMLTSERENFHGVIKLYKSDNLINWVDNGVFFSNDEGAWDIVSPSLIKYGEYWYLTFSSDGLGPKLTHYRYTKDLNNPWIIPEIDYFDSKIFYSGRLEKVYDRLFIFGRLGSRQPFVDGTNFSFSGNLVTHELKQRSDGSLYPLPVKEVMEKVNHQVKYNPVKKSTDVIFNNLNNSIKFTSVNNYDYLLFDKLEFKPTIMTYKVNIDDPNSQFGMMFSINDSIDGPLNKPYNLLFNGNRQKLEFYYDEITPTMIDSMTPHLSVDLKMEAGNELIVTLLMEKSCLSVYVNDQIALSARMYFMSSYPFGFFSIKSNVDINEIKFYE